MEYDPDVLSGFNSNVFDIPYILKRVVFLGVAHDSKYWSRYKKVPVTYVESTTSSNQKGTEVSYRYSCPGRTMFDIMKYISDTMKLRDYSLKGICDEIFKEDDDYASNVMNKIDLADEHYPEVPYNPESEDDRSLYDTYTLMKPLMKFERGRKRIADYCLRDSELLVNLNNKLLLLIVVVQMCKTLGCTMDDCLNRGKIHKLTRKLIEYSLREGFVFPTFNTFQMPVMPETYEGAVVLDPVAGFYDDCVTVLDFKSLYPSIMRAWNLSFDTLITPRSPVVHPQDIDNISTGDRFVKPGVRKGIITMIEEELMNARSATKKEMKKYPEGSLTYNVYDGKQLAIKECCNSLYGFTGARKCKLPLVNIAASICKIGQEQILRTKKFIEDNYKELLGCGDEISVSIVYGDTDSVFVRMKGLKDVDVCIKYSKILEAAINKQLYEDRPPMEIEYEKIFFPFLLLKKKKYISLKWTSTNDKSKAKLSYSGVEIARRDASMLCTDAMNEFVKHFFVNDDLKAGIESLVRRIQQLFDMNYETLMFRIGKRIKKPYAEYKKPIPAHIVLWKRLVDKYGEDAIPRVGQYMYFICADIGKVRNSGDNFVYYPHAVKGNINPDLMYYFDAAFVKPMERLLKYIVSKKTLKQIFDVKRYNITKITHANKHNLLKGNETIKTKIVRNVAPLVIERATNEEVEEYRRLDFKVVGRKKTSNIRKEIEQEQRKERQLNIQSWFVPKG